MGNAIADLPPFSLQIPSLPDRNLSTILDIRDTFRVITTHKCVVELFVIYGRRRVSSCLQHSFPEIILQKILKLVQPFRSFSVINCRILNSITIIIT